MPNKFLTLLTLLTLSWGLLAACNSEPAESTSGASQTTTGQTTSPDAATSTGSGTEAPGTGGVTEGVTGGMTEGATMSGEVTVAPETGTSGETATTGEPGTSTGAVDLCAGYKPPGCKKNDCAKGEECKVVEGMCVPSACNCDPATGTETCTPDCGGPSCVPACGDILCDLKCEFGFKSDMFGCQICECVEGPPPVDCGCVSDKECVKTSSGCCPCNAGGDEVAAHMDCVEQVMLCDKPPEDVICPQVYQCTDAKPVCVAGQCVLTNL
ncbi:MAG: hypothetical protein H0T76_12980 [Nannocystis sp.]|nr:hypothetical protein [Nannocystis sp.]MBA3547394.1 hypothetical protein [Nannocystis sp.]